MVSAIIPNITRAAWNSRKDELKKAQPGLTKRQFIYNISHSSYVRNWGRAYKQPGFGTRALAFLIRLLPKIGPLRALSFKTPTPQTDLLFQSSFDRTLQLYRGLLADAASDRLVLANRDLDTGEITRPAEYTLADEAYSELAITLEKKNSPGTVDPLLREEILAYFRNPELPYATKSNRSKWQDTLAALRKLQAL